MAYPQPSSNDAVLAGDKVFRLHTKLISAGDCYQSEQSGFAFAIGPDSDIANVNINYFDDTLDTRMNQITIGQDSPFVGLIDARNEPGAVYQPQGVQGRIIFSVADIVPVLFEVVGFPEPPENQVRISPVLDIIQYFTPPPSDIVAPRNDKEYFFAVGDTGAYTNDVLIFEIPFYGRSYADIFAFNVGGDAAGTIKIEGLRFGYGVADLFAPSTKELLTTTNLSSATVQHQVNARSDGMFDYLRVTIGNTGGAAGSLVELGIKVSDTAK
jgi:hypothetical protein